MGIFLLKVSQVDKLTARGGNSMRYAIEDCVRRFPDTNDILINSRTGSADPVNLLMQDENGLIMCDGDTKPFSMDPASEASTIT